MKKILLIMIFITNLINIHAGEIKMNKILCVIGSQNRNLVNDDVDVISSASTNIDGEIFPGSTISIAHRIKNVLEKNKYSVDIVTAVENIEINQYDLIIIGSGIYGGQIHESIISFVNKNKSILMTKNVAVFAVCGRAGTSDDEKREKVIKNYSKKMELGLNPIHSAVFGGVVDDTGRFSTWLLKLFLGITPGDHRNWENIENWASSLFVGYKS